MRNIQGLDYKLRANYFVIVIFFTAIPFSVLMFSI